MEGSGQGGSVIVTIYLVLQLAGVAVWAGTAVETVVTHYKLTLHFQHIFNIYLEHRGTISNTTLIIRNILGEHNNLYWVTRISHSIQRNEKVLLNRSCED